MEYSKWHHGEMPISDLGPEPAVVNIDRGTRCNSAFRRALWTGEHLQLTLMCIPVGGEIGLEMHEDTDQFLRIESGCALVKMGCAPNELTKQQRADGSFAILVPAGTWHNILNVGSVPLKLYSVYAPPKHPVGTVDLTKRDAEKRD